MASSGSGMVTSTPSGISCGAACNASFTANASVTLSAVPATGYTFQGWSGACTGTTTCSVSMSQARSVSANFATTTPAPTGSSFTFLAYGDSRAGTICDANSVHIGLVNKMAAEPADFVFNVGDMVAGMDSTTNWIQRGACTADASRGSLKEIIAPLQGKTPAAGLPTFYFPVVGNHDDGWGDGWYPDKFGNGFCDVFSPASYVPNHTQNKAYFADFKNSSVSHYADAQYYSLMCDKTTANANKVYSKYMYYSFDYKNSHFAVMRLNSDYVDLMEHGGDGSDLSNYDMYYNKHQLDWLRYDLAQANARGVQNIFVLTHAPLMTTSDGHAANASWPTLLKEFSKYKAKIVFSGHAHVYERSYPVTASDANPGGVRDDTNGTVYNVTGGGGSYPDGFSRTSSLSAVRASGSNAYHYLRVDVNGASVNVKAIGLDGRVLDSYTR
ncbi:MAG: metallophosphoesterase [Rhizobacter sp.]